MKPGSNSAASPKEDADKVDLRVEDSKGNSIEWTDLDPPEFDKVTLHYADGKATAAVESLAPHARKCSALRKQAKVG